MPNTALNVSVGKPKVSGGIYSAPLGSTLPTDATTALDAAFESVGYIAQGGVTNSIDMSSDNYRAWGGDVVLTYQTEKTDKFAFGLIEVLNPATYEIAHGTANVSGTLATGMTIRASAREPEERAYVIELALRDGAMKRIVIPDGKVSEIGDIVYEDEAAISYPITITAQAGDDGDTHKEYIAKP